MQFSPDEKRILIESVELFNKLKKEHLHIRTVDFSLLYSVLSKEHIALLKRIISLSPKAYGMRGEYCGIQEVPSNLVMVRRQYLPRIKKTISTGTHFLPPAVYNAYHQMNRAMLRDIDKKVLIESGYRSSAYQLIIFLEHLIAADFDVQKTLKRVALPGYSEHCTAKHQAVDFITADEVSGTKISNFEKTKEYKWLLLRADEFGFHLSYPRKNKLGVMFEPWHWRYKKPEIS